MTAAGVASEFLASKGARRQSVRRFRETRDSFAGVVDSILQFGPRHLELVLVALFFVHDRRRAARRSRVHARARRRSDPRRRRASSRRSLRSRFFVSSFRCSASASCLRSPRYFSTACFRSCATRTRVSRPFPPTCARPRSRSASRRAERLRYVELPLATPTIVRRHQDERRRRRRLRDDRRVHRRRRIRRADQHGLVAERRADDPPGRSPRRALSRSSCKDFSSSSRRARFRVGCVSDQSSVASLVSRRRACPACRKFRAIS